MTALPTRECHKLTGLVTPAPMAGSTAQRAAPLHWHYN